MKDEKHELEETIDKKKDDIVELQKELQKANDEVELRKTIVDQMGENLMKHETESMMQAQKLTLMKNQILEYDRYIGMGRKYGAVKINALKNIPVTVSPQNFNSFNLRYNIFCMCIDGVPRRQLIKRGSKTEIIRQKHMLVLKNRFEAV